MLGNIDYCVHFMSRSPTIDQDKVSSQLQLLLVKELDNITLYWQLEELQQFVADMELNAHNLNYNQGDQDNCW